MGENMLFNKKKELDINSIPKHIAIIMDGNGRWAKKRGFTRSMGHREGSRTLKKIVEACYQLGVKYLTVYAFSTENWSRPQEEVDELMKLLLEYLRNAEKELTGKKVRIRVIGEKKNLPDEIVKEIERVEKNTENIKGLDFIIALNYGGRQELVEAVSRLVEDFDAGLITEINEKAISERLYTNGIPNPDLLIRTSGEMRLSNFLIWQLSYSEFYFSDVLWPDFSENHLKEAIISYQGRQRRFGGVKC
ncbi:MAG: isoprenyl transferase [Clostridiaceae bacterium]|nr:isoprenyl transferase [Clostridiaceae bacterium]